MDFRSASYFVLGADFGGEEDFFLVQLRRVARLIRQPGQHRFVNLAHITTRLSTVRSSISYIQRPVPSAQLAPFPDRRLDKSQVDLRTEWPEGLSRLDTKYETPPLESS
jgi:hypothetical protein